ncbi:MAG: BatA domain-containing protein [Flavobacteriales bacterium]
MGFIYPQFLFAFALLAIPIVIHLFNFRRYKRILFADISFLKEIKTQTRQRSQLRQLILLALRLLAVSAIIMAFAQPFWKTTGTQVKTSHKVVSIYIDNSFSMQAISVNGPLLDIAKQRSIDLIKQYDRNDMFQLVTNDFAGIEQRLYPREEIMALIEEVKAGPVSRSLNEVFQRIHEVQKEHPDGSRRIILFSDFQSTLAKAEQIKNTEPVKVIIVPLQQQNKVNLSLDSVWFSSPVHSLNGSEELTFRIRNYSDENVQNASVHVEINGASKAKTSFSVPARSFIDSSVRYTNAAVGIQRGSVSLDDANLSFDNTSYFSYQVKSTVHVLCLVSKQTLEDTLNYDVKNVFKQDPFYHFMTSYSENIDYSSLGTFDLIVLNKLPEISSGLTQELQKYTSTGGSFLVLPSVKSNVGSYSTFMQQFEIAPPSGIDTNSTKVSKINLEDIFFRNVFERTPTRIDLPVSRHHLISAASSRSMETVIMELENGRPLFSRFPYKKGKIYMSYTATEPEGGNFSRHALFVPVLLRAAELSQDNWPSSFTMGRDLSVEIRNRGYSGENVFTFSESTTGHTVIPASQFDGNSVRIFFPVQIREAGAYDLMASNENVFTAAINYDRRESNPAVVSADELKKGFENAGFKDITIYERGTEDAQLSLSALDDQSKLWKWMIWLALIFVFSESALIRIWKT